MKKSELLQNLKNNLEATQKTIQEEAEKEKEIAKESAKKITKEILQIYKEELNNVPKETKKFIKNKMIWSIAMTSLVLVCLIATGGLIAYSMILKKEIEALQRVKSTMTELQQYIALDHLKMSVDSESNTIYLYSDKKKSESYEAKQANVLKIKE